MPWHERLRARLLIPLLSVLFVSMVVAMSWLYCMEREKLLNRTSEDCPRNKTIIMSADDGNRIFRSLNQIENEEECRGCHQNERSLLGVLIVDQYAGRALLVKTGSYPGRNDRLGGFSGA